MDRRMLAIGAAVIALGAAACGDSNTDSAAQGPDVEVEATAPPNSGMIGQDLTTTVGTDRTDAAQGSSGKATDRTDAAQPCGSSLANRCEVQKTDLP